MGNRALRAARADPSASSPLLPHHFARRTECSDSVKWRTPTTRASRAFGTSGNAVTIASRAGHTNRGTGNQRTASGSSPSTRAAATRATA
jgi:hypothetical protein